MFCKNCGKYIQADQRFCPYCGEPVINTENIEETKIIPNLNDDKINQDNDGVKPLGNVDDLTFSKEIEYEEENLGEFDFPEDMEDQEFQFEDEDIDEDIYEDDDVDNGGQMLITNENKRLNIIAIAVSVSIVLVIVIVAIVLSATFGNSGKEDATTVMEETTTVEETATTEDDGPNYVVETTKKRDPETKEETTTKKKKKKEPVTTEKPIPTTKKVVVTTAAPETEPETVVENEPDNAETEGMNNE